MTRIVPMLLALLMAAANPTAQAIADEAVWPQRVIRVILTAAPGSAGDTVARIVTQRLADRLGQQFVIDNRPAAGGTVACEALARSEPDGYTIGMVTTSTHGIASIFNPNLSYDPVKDFVPISMLGSSPYVLAVYPGLPAKTVAELVQLAKSKPKQLNNAAFGTTSLGHLAGVLVRSPDRHRDQSGFLSLVCAGGRRCGCRPGRNAVQHDPAGYSAYP